MLNGLHDDTHKAIRGSTFINYEGSETGPGTEVNPEDTIYDFRGEPWTYLGITRVPNGASSGRVYVESASDSTYKSEFFPSVFDLVIVPRD